MKSNRFTVLDLIDLDLKEHNALNLRCVAGRRGLSREIKVPEINRPGLALSGFFEVFAQERIQVLGRGEMTFIQKKERKELLLTIQKFFSYQIPCCISCYGQEIEDFFLNEAEKSGCPVLITTLDTTELVIRLLRILSTIFAPQKSIHGVLVEVYGIGILIMGESGVGKSETALELIKAGHRLVADDVVEIHCINGNVLLGSGANKIIGHHMEIRGIGVINITHLFGVSAIRDRKKVELIVVLEEWDAVKNYDRIGIEDVYMNILGVDIPRLDIPVKPGRNISIVIETAAMNERLKNMGYNSAKEFNRNILKWIESETAKAVFFGENDVI
ncbi:MAG: HPr(Ser) kinase/phosphatase [Spirochaetaceae bacterium]|jgi:HPr kinase/phosphorylase|nr:HPr(Ser) kinase/phosphatase [Spirochaetaceae bacterium]GMO23879.1 MAG: HPr(Ser) kinase/phosphatase [Termitinemataceae bacterium]